MSRAGGLFELVQGWEQLPQGWSHDDLAGVAIGPDDQVYLLHRGDHPVIVLNRHGEFVDSWGDGAFSDQAHGITIDPEGLIWCTDRYQHTARKFTADGRLLLTLGIPFTPSDTGAEGGSYVTIQRAAGPFNGPTNLAVDADGDLYVSDGYSNCRVHRFSSEGQLKTSWGTPGTGPGEFHLVHSVAIANDGRVFVCDRENDRIQIVDPDGGYLAEWYAQRPSQLQFDNRGWAFVSELPWPAGAVNGRGETVGEYLTPRVSVLDETGAIVSRLGEGTAEAPGVFAGPHGLAVDSAGSLYVAKTGATNARLGWAPPTGITLQKFARLPMASPRATSEDSHAGR